MRYLVTPIFSGKLSAQPRETLGLIRSLLAIIEKSDKASLIREGFNGLPPDILSQNILVFSTQSHDLSVFATFGTGQAGEYILLLDFAVQRGTPEIPAPAYTNPYRNPAINPNRNPAINPNRNPAINPHRNPAINPYRNPAINPNRNPAINPNRNPAINPNRNPAINPHRNPTINPRRNTTINPHLNTAYSGPFIYSRDFVRENYLVRANDKVELIFDLGNEFTGICIKASERVCALFSTNNEWVGYLVVANDKVRLRYKLDHDWTGMVV